MHSEHSKHNDADGTDEEIEMRHHRRETNGCLKILVIYWKDVN